MNPQALPTLPSGDADPLGNHAVDAFLIEKGNRSGPRRTVQNRSSRIASPRPQVQGLGSPRPGREVTWPFLPGARSRHR